MHASKARWWLVIGVAALAVAGLFSIVLVVARTPSLAGLPLFARLFHESLVVHVNLSVLVWFLSMAMLWWSLLAASSGRKPFIAIPYLENAALIAFGGGALVMALSPLDASGGALMSNYIPVINNRIFFLGLALMLSGMGLMLLHLFLARPRRTPASGIDGALHFAVSGSAIIAMLALLAFAWSFPLVPRGIEETRYYDMLFWAGGHLLQFVHAQVQMVGWLVLTLLLVGRLAIARGLLFGLFAVGPLAALFSLYAFLAFDAASMEFREFFTRLMIGVNGAAPSVLMIILAAALLRGRTRNPQHRAMLSCLAMSFLLFAFGGAFGAMIQGQNVTIPAHYHGSIVSVTLAFMGVAYLLLPRFGWREVGSWRLAFWQPIVYGVGQLIHISGLAWSGGYGVLRKTPGALEGGYTASAKAAMGMMGAGGMLAIIGGLMFVIVMVRAMRRAKALPEQA